MMAGKGDSLKSVGFRVEGMQCVSCEKSISQALEGMDGVVDFSVDYVKGKASVTYDGSMVDEAKISKIIGGEGFNCMLDVGSSSMNNAGSSNLSNNTNTSSRFDGGRISFSPSELKRSAVMLSAILIVAGGYFLAKDHAGFELPELTQDASIALIFMLGLFTGFHCIAMCGGLVLSYSANSKKDGIDYASHMSYGFGKTVSYAFFGAVFGFIGSFLTSLSRPVSPPVGWKRILPEVNLNFIPILLLNSRHSFCCPQAVGALKVTELKYLDSVRIRLSKSSGWSYHRVLPA